MLDFPFLCTNGKYYLVNFCHTRSTEFHNFIKMALTKNPRKRPTAEKILQVKISYLCDVWCDGLSLSCYPKGLILWPLSSQHAFVTQLLTRNLAIELLDTVNNPDLQQTHTMDESDLEVNGWQSWF